MEKKCRFGIVVVAHGRLAEDLVKTAEYIAGENALLTYVNVEKNMDLTRIKKKIEDAIKKVDRGHGVVLFTDMFGGTPSNVALSFMKKGKAEVITGVNLPMLLKVCTHTDEMDLSEFAKFIKSYGQKNIQLASEVLNGGQRGKKNGGYKK